MDQFHPSNPPAFFQQPNPPAQPFQGQPGHQQLQHQQQQLHSQHQHQQRAQSSSQQQQPGGPFNPAYHSQPPNPQSGPAGQSFPGTQSENSPAKYVAGLGGNNAAALQKYPAMMQQQMQQQMQRPAAAQIPPQYYNSSQNPQGLSNPNAQRPPSSNKNTATPPRNQSPQATAGTSHIKQHSASNSQSNMATATPNATNQAQQNANAQNAVAGSQPLPPLTPQGMEKEKERVGLLFEINQVLFQDLVELQQQGKGGRLQAKPAKPGESTDEQGNKLATPEYTECAMRLQANLAYIAANAERHTKPADKMPPGPALMTAPDSTVRSAAELAKLYTQLQQMFPGWSGRAGVAKPQSPHTANPANANPPASAG